MKKYPSSLMLSVVAFALVFSLLSVQSLSVKNEVDNSASVLSSFFDLFSSKNTKSPVVERSVEEGEVSSIGKITCVTKTLTQWAPGVHYSLRYKIGTDKLFYVEGIPSLYPYNVNDPVDKIYPYAKYTTGSATNTLDFFYSTQPNDGILNDSYSLLLNPLTGVNEFQGKIYTLSPDGTTYGPIDLSGLNNPTLPRCTERPIKLVGELNIGTCFDGIMNGNETSIDDGGRCDPTGIIGSNSNGGTGKFFGHWCRTENPVTIGVVNEAISYNSFFEQAFADWNLSPVLDLVEGDQVRVKNQLYGNTGWLAATSVGSVGGHIYDAEVLLNDTYLTSGQFSSDSFKQQVLCDGLGHAFGLSHQDENMANSNLGTCMDYTNNPTGPLNNEHPNMNDFIALKTAHHANPADVLCGINKPEGSTGEKINTSADKSTWGEVIAKDAKGNPTIYSKNLGTDSNGQKKVINTYLVPASVK